MYHQQQNKWYLQRCLLAHFEVTLYFSHAEFSYLHIITLPQVTMHVQVNSPQLKSSVASKWASLVKCWPGMNRGSSETDAILE